MKKTITVCITVIICVAMMCGSFVYVGKDFNESIGKLIPSILVSSRINNDKKEPETVPATVPSTESTTEPATEETTGEMTTSESTTGKQLM